MVREDNVVPCVFHLLWINGFQQSQELLLFVHSQIHDTQVHGDEYRQVRTL